MCAALRMIYNHDNIFLPNAKIKHSFMSAKTSVGSLVLARQVIFRPNILGVVFGGPRRLSASGQGRRQLTSLYSRGFPVRRWWREAPLFIPGYECNPPVAPTDLVVYRDTALLGSPTRGTTTTESQRAFDIYPGNNASLLGLRRWLICSARPVGSFLCAAGQACSVPTSEAFYGWGAPVFF